MNIWEYPYPNFLLIFILNNQVSLLFNIGFRIFDIRYKKGLLKGCDQNYISLDNVQRELS